MLADEELQERVNQTIANMLDINYQIGLAKEFYSNKEYKYCHPEDVPKLLDAHKELLVMAEEWTDEFENTYQEVYAAIDAVNHDSPER